MVDRRVKGGYMEKNIKRFLMLGVLAMFMFMFAMQLVMAVNPIGDWFTNWEDTNMSANVAKYLFWALVSMAVYSVALNIPGLSNLFKEGKEWLGMLFSIIVGFLSMAYITPNEIYAMMVSYSALGFVLGGAIPFIILVAFTFTLATATHGKAKQRLANKAIACTMWAGFLAFIVYKTFIAEGSATIKTTPLEWIITIAALLMLIMLGAIFKMFKKQQKEANIEEAKDKIEKSTAKTTADAEAVDKLAK